MNNSFDFCEYFCRVFSLSSFSFYQISFDVSQFLFHHHIYNNYDDNHLHRNEYESISNINNILMKIMFHYINRYNIYSKKKIIQIQKLNFWITFDQF